jgi:hypothetical protein
MSTIGIATTTTATGIGTGAMTATITEVNDDDYRLGWYGRRRYNNRDDYYRSRYPQQPYYGPRWQSFYR